MAVGAAIRTTARRDGAHWILNGAKSFAAHASRIEVYVPPNGWAEELQMGVVRENRVAGFGVLAIEYPAIGSDMFVSLKYADVL